MKNIIKDLETRGLLDAFSNRENIEKMLETKRTIYCGFDPSNKSMQLGNFVMITMLKRLQDAGHKIIALVGGATGMIGDPSGKKAERTFQTEEQILFNTDCLKKQLSKYLNLEDPNKGILLNNLTWWKDINTISYLRDYGKYHQINQMLAKETVKSRLEVGISYAEFSYMLLQAGDFDYLYKNYGCQIQIGGGDQWGNLTTSLDFLRKKNKDSEAECFSLKLITDSEGRKFGKSENGALFLDPTMTSSYDIYQYFINVSDSDVKKYLYIFDTRNLEEIDKIYAKHMEKPELRYGQKVLAYTLTEIIHGKKEADKAVKITEALFNEDFKSLTSGELVSLSKTFKDVITVDTLGQNIADLLIATGLCKSKRESKEMISNKSIKINGEKGDYTDFVLNENSLLDNQFCIIKKGKKNYALVVYKK